MSETPSLPGARLEQRKTTALWRFYAVKLPAFLSVKQAIAIRAALPTMSVKDKMELFELLEERERRLRLSQAQESVLGFAHFTYPGFKEGAHHRVLSRIFGDVVTGKKKRVIINIAPRMGKLLADDTPVLTTRGWTTHGALRPGDEVFSPSGHPVRILAVSDTALADVQMEFFDGTTVLCHEAHEWTLWSMTAKEYQTVEAGAFLRSRKGRWGQTQGSVKQVLSGERALHHLPPVAPLQFPEQELLLHPYVLGAWLGDGSAGKACLTHSEADQAHIDYIASLGYPVSAVCQHKVSCALTTYFSGPRPNVAGRLTKELQALGIYNDKRIPEEYLRGSVEQRLQLLAGLLDTDGTIDKNSRCHFINTNKALVDGVVELVRSFGWRVSVAEHVPKLSSSGVQGKKTCWTLGFQPTIPVPTQLPRKKILRFPETRRIGLKSVMRVPLAQAKTGRCIQVDSDDGLYLVERTLVPTHNSEFTSYLLPAYYFGKFPDRKIIMGTHTASLSEDFGRRVRNLVTSEEYARIFGATAIAEDQKGSGKWSTSLGGQYYAVGVGGSIAGRGADLFVIDDPHSEQDLKSGSNLPFETAWNWFQTGPLQRLMPGGAIIVVMCMTGDTPVLMADGTECPLRSLRPGDAVATYENGRVSTSRVLNQRSNGIDAVFTVKTRSGRIVRANERHPFLVEANGERRWVRLRDLQPGFSLVSLRAAVARPAPKRVPVCVTLAKPARHTTASTRMLRTRLSGIMANCAASLAPLAALLRPRAKVCATPAIASSTPHPSICARPSTPALDASSIATALLQSSMSRWLRSAAAAVTSAGSFLTARILARTGTASSASTIVTTPTEFADCSATTAISLLDTEKHQKSCGAPLSTYNVIADEIVSIESAGLEEVFDVQIERTENFIANGLVSHNTRWSKLDLTAKILAHQIKNPDADQWEVIELPAILHENTDKEKSLWPEQWPLDQLQAKRAGMDPRFWQAQYMQNPTSEIAAIIKREQWKTWEPEKPPKIEYIIQSWDTAHEAKNTSNYSACTTWGVWYNPEDGDNAHIMLLDAIRGRWEFPDLKKRALEHYREWEPDACLIEKKAAGAPLIQELRAMGIPISETSPSRARLGASNDKIVRMNAVADMFASGRVWAPDTRWAREVIEEVASFPSGDYDDYCDTMTQALQRMRNGGFIRLQSDVKDDPERSFRSLRREAYY